MVATDYGSISLPVEEARQERKSWSRGLVLVSVFSAMALATLTIGAGMHRVNSAVDKTITETPDCQCISQCYAADSDPTKGGTWCYSDPKISPCMDASRKVTYGKSWARCRITYGDDDCAGNPCKNQAFCVDGYDSFKCVCRNGWSGSDCTTQVLTEYTVSIATASEADAHTKSAIFVQFTGTDGDATKEHLLSLHGIQAFSRTGDCPDFSAANKGYLQMTITAQDVGDLHKVTYRVGGDDSFKPALLRVEYKGTTYAAVGKLSASESAAPVSVTVVKARKYAMKIASIDSPQWAATKNDISMQLTGKNWQVTGEVVAIPGGMKDGKSCDVNVWGADVGIPAKVTYWISGSDSFLPTKVEVDSRYAAQITKGNRCIITTDKDGKALANPLFIGDSDTGRSYAYKDANCKKDKTTDGCTGYEGCRKCVLWDPDTKKDEVLCPWALPYTDGRYIIVDLADKMKDQSCKLTEDPKLENGDTLPDECKKDATVKSGVSCELKCKAGYGISGTQPKCEHGEFSKGSLKCTLTVCDAKACNGDASDLKGAHEFCLKEEKTCCDTKDDLQAIKDFKCSKKPCWSKGKKCPKECTIDATPSVTDANPIPANCKKGEVLQNGHSCKLTCKTGYVLSGDQPKCDGGTYKKGSVKCAKKVDTKCTAGQKISEAGKCTCASNADGAKDKYCLSSKIVPLCAKTDGSTATSETNGCACPTSDKAKAALCAKDKKCTAGKDASTVGTCA